MLEGGVRVSHVIFLGAGNSKDFVGYMPIVYLHCHWVEANQVTPGIALW